MNLQQYIRVNVVKISTLIALPVLLGIGQSATAAALDITNDPLYLADSIAPGIFIMMDDSGSMDWEVLTEPFYDYEDYYEDGSTLVNHGRFYGYTTDQTCDDWSSYYTYIFDNGDNKYTSCTSYGATVEENSGVYDRDWRILSADFNVMYYDPDLVYKPWIAKDDDSSNTSAENFTDASFSAVKSNPQPGESGYSLTRDLGSDGFVWEVADTESYGFCGTSPDGPEYDYDHNRCASDSDCDGTCNKSKVDLWDTHTRYTIVGNQINVDIITYNLPSSSNGDCPSSNNPSAAQLNTCFGRQVVAQTAITDATEVAAIKQNVANWYQYHRKRQFIAKAGVASVMESAPFYRFGMGTLQNEFFQALPAGDVTTYISHNQDLFNKFAEWNWQSQGTHLRSGLKISGEYFKGSRTGYTADNKPIIHQCQQNFTILFTDGFYNGSVWGYGDQDSDGLDNSLADVARYYYTTDLDTIFANVVPTTDFDTQNQQHMVTFSVAFGVSGNLMDTDADGWPDPVLAENSLWSSGSIDQDAERIDDMWHAAYNSRGAYISAQTPVQVVQGLNDALSSIQDKVGTASSAAASTGASVLTETNVFFAYYDSNDWSGDIVANDIVTDDVTSESSFNNNISASTNFYNNLKTQFYSWNPADNSAIDFSWAEINAAQKVYLNDNPDTVSLDDDSLGEQRLAFITGDTSYDGTTFRDRNGKTFGDILNSAPQFVGGTLDENGNALAFINSDLTEAGSYSLFQSSKSARSHMIYVGANDGMLHALIVDSNPATTLDETSDDLEDFAYLEDFGKEAFAYIPSAVIKRLNKLTSTEYTKKGIGNHRYMVDGSPRIQDAYVSGNWKTVLVSGLGAGGQGIFALDVSDGASVSANNVLWEFNDSDDPDLGYTYSRPVIARLRDGNWYAIVGNGYNNTEANDMDNNADASISTTGHAVLFLLKLSGPSGEDGAWLEGTDYYKLDTQAGSSSTPNGLATVSAMDYNRDQVVDAVYGGDLQGNLWRFDLLDGDTNINSGSFTTSTLAIAYKDGDNNPMPVFTTQTGQPITSAPVVISHPIDGFMVLFGTGQYVESGDNQTTGQPTQSLYGIWDNCIRGDLVEKLGNSSVFKIQYSDVTIPASTPAACSTVSSSELLQQVHVQEITTTFEADDDNDGTADRTYTEDVRVPTRYKILFSDYDTDGDNTTGNNYAKADVNSDGVPDSYNSEKGWLNEDKDEIHIRGWYLNMEYLGNNNSERNTNKPLILGGTVFFNTYTPESSTSDCGANGNTWIYSLNSSDGRQLEQSAFDLNRDGQIDQQDEFNAVNVIGARREDGFTPEGTVIHAGSKKHHIAFGGNTGIEDTFFKHTEGRQAWRVVQ